MSERIAFFIDGANFYAASKIIGQDIDYKKLLKQFQDNGERLVRAFYYTAVLEDQEYSSIRPLLDWLDYNGYTVVTKATKEFIGADGGRKIKGNMDIEIAVDMLSMAKHLDHVYLFSGDGDFRYLIEEVQRQGVRVTVVSYLGNEKLGHAGMVANELRRQADTYLDMSNVFHKFAKAIPLERGNRAAIAAQD